MKIVYILFFALMFSNLAKAQPGNDIFTAVEKQAHFPGGDSAWKKFIKKNLNFSVPLKEGAPKGQYTVIIQFIVSKDGSISDIKALTEHGYGMEKECIRVIKKSGKWIPAMQNGKAVGSYRRQPITFVIE